MLALRTAFFAAVGALIMLALHFALNPALGGTCEILCRPERATIAGLVLGGLVGFLHARGLQKQEHEDEQEHRPAGSGPAGRSGSRSDAQTDA